MKVWGYYAFHTFINSIKKIFKSKIIAVILCCMVIGGLVGGTVGVIGSFVEDRMETGESTEYEDEDVSGDDAEVEEEMTEEDIAFLKDCIAAGTMILLLAFLLWGIYSGSKNGGDIFMMADVNFLFPAPMKAQSVLMFRLSFQMVALMFGSLYLVFQIPNLVINAGLDAFAVVTIFIAWIMFLFLSKIMSVFTYTLTATHERLKSKVIPFVLTVAAVVFLATAAVFLATGKDVAKTLALTYCSPWSDYVPVFGWFKAMVMNGINGNIPSTVVFLVLNLLTVFVLCFFTWRLKADFYEDALTGAAKREELTKAASEGRNLQQDEKKSARRAKRLEKKAETNLKGWGASTFFHKNMMNRKRFSKFGFVTNTMLTYFTVGILLGAFFWKATDIREIDIIGFIFAGILFFRNFGNPIGVETSHNWLFLVPDNPYKKVFFALMPGIVDSALDLIPGLLAATVILGCNPLATLLWYVTLISMDFMFSCFGILMEALLPASSMDMVKSIMQMMFRFMIIVVIIICFMVGSIISGVVLGAVICIVVDILIGIACFVAYPSLLHNGIG